LPLTTYTYTLSLHDALPICKVSLGPVSKTKKYDAENKLAQILEPINVASQEPDANLVFQTFVSQVYLPFYKRKWKTSTANSNERSEEHTSELQSQSNLVCRL